MPWHAIEQAICRATNTHFSIQNRSPINGGCINQAFLIGDAQQRFFVKTNHANLSSMFEAEKAGLEEIQNSQSIKCPQPVTCGTSDQMAFLVLEYLDMGSSKINDELFGQQLAKMHTHTSQQFGWYRNNTIGSTHQNNQLSPDWISFWHQQRLDFQLRLAANHSHRLLPQGEKLLEALPLFFTNYQPRPALLHGDLWSGNYSSLSDGTPVIFDPAVYYGDRETDLAMTELFGGFSTRFYAAYNEALPLDAGYQTRKTLYNLYHILNHLNLFGNGYLSQSESMINALLAEIK